MTHDSLFPQAVLDAVIKSDGATAGTLRLPADTRPAVEAWLARVVADFDAYVAHVDYLRQHLNVPARPWDAQPAIAALGLGFAHHRPLPFEQEQAVVRLGLGELPDDTLAELLLNPVALDSLARQVEAAPGPPWRAALAAAGAARMAARDHRAPQPPDPVVGPTETLKVHGYLTPDQERLLREALPGILKQCKVPIVLVEQVMAKIKQVAPARLRESNQRMLDVVKQVAREFSN
jgi:hypothetical protein